MLIVGKADAYFWPVKFREAADGKFVDAEFDAQFKRLEQPRIDEITEATRAGKMTDQQVLDEVWVGWRKVKTEDGAVLEFSEDNKLLVLAKAAARTAIVLAWMESVTEGARRKN